MSDWYEIGFANQTVKLDIPLGFSINPPLVQVSISALPVNIFVGISNHLQKPSGMSLYHLVKDNNLENWNRFKQEVDPSSKWLKEVLNYHLKDFGIFKNIVLNLLIKTYGAISLFRLFALMNGLILYFDPPKELAVFIEEKNNRNPIDQDLTIFVSLQKFGITEMNNQKLSIQNLKEVLSFVQYFYFCKSPIMQELMIFINPNLMLPEDKEKEDNVLNIEKHYLRLEGLMKSFNLEEKDWYSEKAQPYRFRINRQSVYKALYNYFKPKT